MTTRNQGDLLDAETRVPGWSVKFYDRVESTQQLARGRPVWSAVVAREQTAGRGQADRTFTSDPGGLYVTAVLPYAGDPMASRGFALAVGWAVREALLEFEVGDLRLRWPNDLMVGDRKVGGILVEQDGPGSLLVGIGLNVTNHPWLAAPELAAIAGRLADTTPYGRLPEAAVLASSVLVAIRAAHEVFSTRRLAGFTAIANNCWGAPREVELEPVAGIGLPLTRGRFMGIDAEGNLLLEGAAKERARIPSHHVARLRER
ncbi:MAG: biotin--[acetyl-CoA-carboxylase] ligase [Verrucomicrobia bacterium]|jgi:BirA family biotin operon repressor/biotin-[acetyl-CoA-carboxylase] ligase|nr:biotin--[acetyl-CoA-carboxylase] ligase [Verrucomicrobiota bacterium]